MCHFIECGALYGVPLSIRPDFSKRKEIFVSSGPNRIWDEYLIGVKLVETDADGKLMPPCTGEYWPVVIRSGYIRVCADTQVQEVNIHVPCTLHRRFAPAAVTAGIHIDGLLSTHSGLRVSFPNVGIARVSEEYVHKLGFERLRRFLRAIYTDVHDAIISDDSDSECSSGSYAIPVLFKTSNIVFGGTGNVSVSEFHIMPYGFWAKRKTMLRGLVIPLVNALLRGPDEILSSSVDSPYPHYVSSFVADWPFTYAWAKSGYDKLAVLDLDDIHRMQDEIRFDSVKKLSKHDARMIELICQTYAYLWMEYLRRLFKTLKAANYEDSDGNTIQGIYEGLR